MEPPIKVTSPLLPPLEDFYHLLEDIWQRQTLTNNGPYLQQLEQGLREYLKVNYLTVVTNGTVPISIAVHALGITGEIITTPYSFIGTSHSLSWHSIKPVYVDVDPKTANLDPDKIEEAITPRTTAIMPVHVYGNPCDTKRIQEIADKHGLKIIYDAAHAFGVEVDGKSVLEEGDISTLSFHATKVFNTAEGGAMICRDLAMEQRLDCLRKFGFSEDGEKSITQGTNAKMDEMRAALGLLNLKIVDRAIEIRRKVTQQYREALRHVPGISFIDDIPGVRHNYAYCPMFVNEREYGMSRNDLHARMREHGILSRKYFHPLISNVSPYCDFASASPDRLPIANRMSSEVICLPLHHELTEEQVSRVIRIVQNHGRP